MLQISAVLEEQVEPMHVCDFYSFLLAHTLTVRNFLGFFSVLLFRPDAVLTACSSLLLAFFAF